MGISVRVDYVVFASGVCADPFGHLFALVRMSANARQVLSNAKLPQVEGFDVFEGHSFHVRFD